ncbi:hypothetical protein KJ969_00915 [Patescibacteria group bacterium]|nr:hypothetical protein [Patescibacteria group bacterium]MBU1922101.1 hypothetical protein [Patescibacteria group bacterium]
MIEIKNSLKKIFKPNRYSRSKIAIGSFFIIGILGFSSFIALSTTDSLVKWAPEQTEFYFHLRANKTDLVQQKLEDYQPFENLDYKLVQLLPQNFKEFALFSAPEYGTGLLILSLQAPAQKENLIIKKLDQAIFLLSAQEMSDLQENKTGFIENAGLSAESAMAQGYIFLDQTVMPQISPTAAGPWISQAAKTPGAWSLEIKNESIIWKNQAKQGRAPDPDPTPDKIPQNTLFWTHGHNFMEAMEQGFNDLLPSPSLISVATQGFLDELDRANRPEQSFQALFEKPFNVFVLKSQDQASYVLTLEKEAEQNPIILNNFESFLLKIAQQNSPRHSTVVMPDKTTYTELTLNQDLAWQDLKINNYTIRWIKGEQDQMIIGYFINNSSITMSNDFGNLIDFLYSQDKKSWIDLAQAAKACELDKNNLSAFFSPNMDMDIEATSINKLFSRLIPWFISDKNDFCYVDKYVNNP